MEQQTTAQTRILEFNSNIAVLERCSKIIDSINATRFYLVTPDNEHNPSILELINHLVNLYKEISVELNDNEKKIYEKIELLRTDTILKRKSLDRAEGSYNPAYFVKVIKTADDVDLELRHLAKLHGFLARNVKTGENALVEGLN